MKPDRVKTKMQDPGERIHNFDEVVLGYTREAAIEEAKRCIACKKAHCDEACPLHCCPADYIAFIEEGDFDKALEQILEYNPFPSTCGRVCVHYCEEKCPVGKKGTALAIAWLKRAAADYGQASIAPGKPTGKKVAVIGAGPAGFTVAWECAKAGHRVAIFEALSSPGGMLWAGIPSYRLPRAALDKDMQRILDLGVELRLNSPIRSEQEVSDLLDQYDAVFIGIGAHEPRWMGIEGEELEGVVHVVDFLRDVNQGKDVKVGKETAVIGGGSSAMDAVRTARRFGADAFIVYRRAREQMPADEAEIEQAEEEGIVLNLLTNPTRILGENGKMTGLECLRMELGEPDESGRRRPVPIEGSEFVIEADMMIQAISQRPDITWLDENSRFKTTRWQTFEVDPETNETSVPGVFAAGDAVSGPATIVEAIADALKAAKGILKYLEQS
ncbi:MAG: dihydropyrimidine dehydrogenase [Chloroflexi bacterium B3_Chlor]|nr:MAG: dihydropyrimidine dehydrogenase [Chloroflexi bacterium B3_Chlor]